MFERRARSEEQSELWVKAGELPSATPDAFYRRVNATLEKIDFAREVWAICEPAYAQPSRGGRPGIDPVVYLKMLTVGFFENLPSERAIASRCADSLSIRGYLGYSLTEATPDYSSLSVIRARFTLEQLGAIHRVLLKALREHGLQLFEPFAWLVVAIVSQEQHLERRRVGSPCETGHTAPDQGRQTHHRPERIARCHTKPPIL
mgnify:CR=1 FL=1